MRIISGSLGGRTFDSPPGNRTHPMSENIRGALFNALGDVSGLSVLDAFAGTGALSFEALSRGAKSAVMIDIDTGAINTIVNSLHNLGLSTKAKAIRANASQWSANNPDVLFDLVVCDPPYDDINEKLLEKLANHTKPGGLIVLSLPPSVGFQLLTTHYQLLTSKNYGDSKLLFYRSGGIKSTK